MITTNLPFPRGQTASAGTSVPGPVGLVSTLPTATGKVTEANAYRKDLSGLIVETLDHQLGNGGTVGSDNTITTPGTMQRLRLRLVQAAAAITVSKLGLLIQFSTTAKEFGVVSGTTYAAADKAVCKPLDNAYPIGKVISTYDWFYVVEEGPAYIGVLSGQTLTQGGPVASAGNGLAGAGTAGEAIVGTAQQTITGDGTVATDYALVTVAPGLVASDAAG